MVNDVARIAEAEMRLMAGSRFKIDYYPLPGLGASRRRLIRTLAAPLRLVSYLPTVRALRIGGYDCLHVHWVSQGVAALFVGRPFIIHAHGSDLHQNFKWLISRAVSRYVLRRASRIIYVTPNLAAYLSEYKDKAVLVGNPIDEPGRFAAPLTDVKRILIFTRLDPIKGVDIIFSTIEQMSPRYKVTALAWGPLAEDYQLRYGQSVTFVEPVPHDRVFEFLSGYDAVIGQMHQGILSLSELEVMSMGLPLITAVDPDLYAADPPPVLRARNGDEILKILAHLSESPASVHWLVGQARDWVRRHHSPSEHRRALEEIYSAVIAGASRNELSTQVGS
jgi:glycosyltransferase involved in cell wall biosynthesis